MALIASNAAAREIPVGIGTLAIRSRLGGVGGRVARAGLRALSQSASGLPCCPEQSPLQCPTGSDSFCVGGDPTQPCDPTCGTSETITFGTGPTTGAGAGAGTPSVTPGSAQAAAAAAGVTAGLTPQPGATTGQPSGTVPTTTGPNWGLILLFTVGGIVGIKLLSGGGSKRRRA